MNIIYRKGIPSDIDEMYKIDQECFVETIAYSYETFLEFFDSPRKLFPFIEVAEWKNKIIGFIIGIQSHKDAFTIITIDIKKEFRGKQIAQTLLNHLEKFYNEIGLKYGILQVSKKNKRAIKFYEKNQYKFIRTLSNYYQTGENGLEYIKKLSIIKLPILNT